MKNIFKKSIAILGLSMLVSIFSAPFIAFAEVADSDVNNSYVDESLDTTTVERTEDEVNNDLEMDLQQQMDALNSQNSLSRVPKYSKYIYKDIEQKYRNIAGYVGNQPPKGKKFPTGGGFYYSNSGGPTISVNAGWAGISISTNIGSSASSGDFVTVPNNKQYFKLYTSKKYLVKKKAVYGVPLNNPKGRVFLYYVYPKALQSTSSYAKKV